MQEMIQIAKESGVAEGYSSYCFNFIAFRKVFSWISCIFVNCLYIITSFVDIVKPRIVKLTSSPFLGKTQFTGGYAQFGFDLEKSSVQVMLHITRKQNT